MEENRLDILIPSAEHIAELKEKGIDIELELARVVCDNLRLIKADKNPRRLGIAVTKHQMDELQKYGINGPEMCAAEFKKELHRMLMDKRREN
jgi:hypothetical protein